MESKINPTKGIEKMRKGVLLFATIQDYIKQAYQQKVKKHLKALSLVTSDRSRYDFIL